MVEISLEPGNHLLRIDEIQNARTAFQGDILSYDVISMLPPQGTSGALKRRQKKQGTNAEKYLQGVH